MASSDKQKQRNRITFSSSKGTGVKGLILTSPGLVEHLRKKAQKAQPPKDK